ncbi:MAG: tRNA (N(6)-L-threonylcarbamoyladenosine(37)-C(2))-methylthiotransferase MtaB [Chloroflexota bacterium]
MERPRSETGPTVAFATLGCKVNQAETDTMAAGLARAGFRRVEFGRPADVVVINTCTVTHVADRKSRQLVRQARRLNERALVVATGCYAEIAPDTVAELGVDVVVGNRDKDRLVDVVLGVCPIDAPPALGAPPKSRTRAFLKVQDGCDNFCTYCIVPHARGRQRSVPLASVIAAAQAREAEGFHEVVLTGVHVGAYGRDFASGPLAAGEDGLASSPRLAGLLRAILVETALERVRLSSLEPEDLTPELLALWREHPGRLCRHFHLPLQSGSDGVLHRMGRRYRTADYARLVAEVRRVVPGAAITTDLMVGFPGESEQEYAETREFVRGMGFAGMHVFRYSPRPGTPAARLPGQVRTLVAKERSEEMLALAAAAAARFRAALQGDVLPVLFEERSGNGDRARRWTGLTDNYVRVYADGRGDLTNRLLLTRLLAEQGDGLVGQIVA